MQQTMTVTNEEAYHVDERHKINLSKSSHYPSRMPLNDVVCPENNDFFKLFDF